MKTKVIFICIHNSARSQMAEMFLNELAGDRFEAKSAGLEAGKLNPFVVKAMGEIGIDMSANKTKTVQDILETGESFDYVITVCDKEAAERCLYSRAEGGRNSTGGDLKTLHHFRGGQTKRNSLLPRRYVIR